MQEELRIDRWRDADYNVLEQFQLNGKKGFVTGGAGGIGRNIAAAWLSAGADVALVDLPSQKEALEQLVTELNGRYDATCYALYCDVTNKDDLKQLKQNLIHTLGTVDIAAANAGANFPGDDEAIDHETWVKSIDLNLNGAFFTAQVAYDIMQAHDHGGSIIVTSSISGSHANFLNGTATPVNAYGSAKAGVLEMVRYLAAVLAPKNIRINAISPGYTYVGDFGGRMPAEAREMLVQAVPMKRFGLTEEFHGPALFLASDASSYITGINLFVDGGYDVF